MASSLGERTLVAFGIVAVCLGAVVLLVPGAATLVGASDVLVSLLGLVALVQAARTVTDVWDVPRTSADLPDPGRTESATSCGETFDVTFERAARHGTAGERNRARVERYLRDVAVAVLAAEQGDPPDAVRARLDDGTWTDDPVAVALFAEEYVPGWRDRVRSLSGRETTFQRRVRRAVAALESETGETVRG